MASTSANKNEVLAFKPERPHFFKIILHDSIRLHKLGIPKKFVQSFGDHLSSPVILKVPSGIKWKVDIVKSDGEIWLQNGWPEFAEYYSIAHGTLLVFEYEKRDYEFNVIIFDKSCTEIDYPFPFTTNNGDNSGRANLHEPNMVDEVEDDVSVEILDHVSPSPIAKVISPISLPSSPKGRQRLNRTDTRKNALRTNEEKANAIQTGSSNFQSQNPSFRIVIQPSHVHKRNVLVIPPSFARKYLNQSGDAILNVLDGRTWPIKYYSKTSFGNTTTRIEHFSWNKFVKDVHLKVGDVCIFELIDHVKTILRVVKNANAANYCTKTSLEKESRSKERKLSFSDPPKAKGFVAKKSTSVNPSFRVEISSKNLNHGLVHVPKSFMKKMKQETKETRLMVKNRWWPVKLLVSPESRRGGQFSAGWTAFAMENFLKLGDICTFELINNGETPLISVSIMRASGICSVSNGDDKEAEPQLPTVEKSRTEISYEISPSRKRKQESPLSCSQPPKKLNKVEDFLKITGKGTNSETKKENPSSPDQEQRVNRISEEKPKAIDRASSSFQFENPTFWIAVQPSHLHRDWSAPDIHALFVRKYMKRKDGDALLNVLGGKTWSVKYSTNRIGGVIRTKMMHSGWQKFVKGNHLQVGDICTFELIDPDKTVFTVIISKSRVTTNLCSRKQSMGKESSIRERDQKPSFSYCPEAIEAAKKFTSVFPFFQVAMTSRHLQSGSNVHVPRKFIKNLERVRQNVKLQVDNRFWSANLIIYPDNGKSSLCGGWISFARENYLKEGDVCSFELIDTQKLLIKVSIFRSMSNN